MEAKNWWSFCRWYVFPFPKGANQRTRTKLVEFCRCSLFLRWTAFGISGSCFQISVVPGQPRWDLSSRIRTTFHGAPSWRMAVEDGFLGQKNAKKCWKFDIVMKFQIKCGNLQLVMKFADINKCWVGSNSQWIYGKFFEWFARLVVAFGLGVHKALNFMGRCPTGHSWIQRLIPGKISYYNWVWFVSCTGGAILLMVQKSGEKTTWDV